MALELKSFIRESPYFRLGWTPVAGVACLQRTAHGYASLAAVHEEVASLLASLAESRASGALIVDMRQARPRNDDAFEDAMERLRISVGESFDPVIILIRTAAGEMQSTRLHRQAELRYQISSDENEALRIASQGARHSVGSTPPSVAKS